ncbi:MAG: hypothetical protein A3E88_03740 [Legionellales bacterium RIFCSPHIGHO2_12_FULL_35_11]|nr:MAG: hypothetical protein A3E88_03740 [Legionellales bacterium RIFCSPHIGHO2_12_FULL_35_11]
MLDLISLWNKTTIIQNANEVNTSRQYADEVKQAAINFDRNTTQSSFEFQDSPNVIFVKNIASLEPADFYDQLAEITMTKEENDARLKFFSEQMAKNPKLFDGKQMVITGVIYDDSTNTIYMEAKKVPYSFIATLRNKKFPENSHLYQLLMFTTGVLAPLIARNGTSILLQRVDLGLYSVPGGFLEAHDKEKRLNFYDGRNLVTETAITELKEEIVGIKGTDELRFDFSKTQISSISFRKTGANLIGTVEFVAPSYANCHSSYLQEVIRNNLAKDAHEHTSEHQLIPLKSKNRDKLLEIILTGTLRLPGASLYLPVALSLTRLENQASCMMALPRAIPNSSSIAWPLSIFKANPEKLLSYKEPENEIYRDRF